MKILRTRSFLLPLLALPLLLTQTARADYQSTVLGDGPKAYYRLNDNTSRSNTNKNSGSLGAAGNAINDLMIFKTGTNATGVVHPFPGAIVGDRNRSEFFDFTTRAEIPFNAAVNPDNTKPFTVEVWFYPASDQINTGESPINNRVSSGFPDRTGWTFFQRSRTTSYIGKPGFEGVGWNFQNVSWQRRRQRLWMSKATRFRSRLASGRMWSSFTIR